MNERAGALGSPPAFFFGYHHYVWMLKWTGWRFPRWRPVRLLCVGFNRRFCKVQVAPGNVGTFLVTDTYRSWWQVFLRMWR